MSSTVVNITDTLTMRRDGVNILWRETRLSSKSARDPDNVAYAERMGWECRGFPVYAGTDVPIQPGHPSCPKWLRADWERRRRNKDAHGFCVEPPPDYARKNAVKDGLGYERVDGWAGKHNFTLPNIGIHVHSTQEPARQPQLTRLSDFDGLFGSRIPKRPAADLPAPSQKRALCLSGDPDSDLPMARVKTMLVHDRPRVVIRLGPPQMNGASP